ncbi:hypothetical protein GCM10020229_14830 [Kitasatospora albolonga]
MASVRRLTDRGRAVDPPRPTGSHLLTTGPLNPLLGPTGRGRVYATAEGPATHGDIAALAPTDLTRLGPHPPRRRAAAARRRSGGRTRTPGTCTPFWSRGITPRRGGRRPTLPRPDEAVPTPTS